MKCMRVSSISTLAVSLLFCVLGIHLCTAPVVAADSGTLSAENMDMSGDWYALFDSGGWGSEKTVVRMVKKGDTFVGNYVGDGKSEFNQIRKGDEKIKCRIDGNMIVDVFMNDPPPETHGSSWEPCEVVICKTGKRLVFTRTSSFKGSTTVKTLTLDRDPL